MSLLPLLIKAQVTINAQLPSAGLVQKDQLWNLIIVNSREESVHAFITMKVQDAVTGQEVMSAATGDIEIGRGVKLIAPADVAPVLYHYNTIDFARTYLPMGAYIVCYRLSNTGGEEGPFAEECTAITIDPLSPPLLNTPSDQAVLETPYPQFTWMPPTPFDMFTQLSYDIMITEVLQGQSATEAIQYNTPVYSNNNIQQPYQSYASSFNELDTGKTYAWQVTAKNGLNYAAKTEVWTFELKQQTKPVIVTEDVYILLDNNIQGVYSVSAEILKVKYFSFHAAHEAQVVFLDEKDNVIRKTKQKIAEGDNYLDFNLKNDFQQNKLYKFTITDAENKAHSLLFNINKN